jgi:hypothetical protein
VQVFSTFDDFIHIMRGETSPSIRVSPYCIAVAPSRYALVVQNNGYVVAFSSRGDFVLKYGERTTSGDGAFRAHSPLVCWLESLFFLFV